MARELPSSVPFRRRCVLTLERRQAVRDRSAGLMTGAPGKVLLETRIPLWRAPQGDALSNTELILEN
jgi:hypothetical protein